MGPDAFPGEWLCDDHWPKNAAEWKPPGWTDEQAAKHIAAITATLYDA